jgi:hypothetical protein
MLWMGDLNPHVNPIVKPHLQATSSCPVRRECQGTMGISATGVPGRGLANICRNQCRRHLQLVVWDRLIFPHLLKCSPNPAFPIAIHSHRLHLNRTQNCNESTHMHLHGVVWRNCYFQIRFSSCLVWHLPICHSIQFLSGLVFANFKFTTRSLKISQADLWFVILAYQVRF